MFSFDSWEEEKHKRDEKGRFTKSESSKSLGQEEGAFGKIYTQFYHDSKGAVHKLMQEQEGEAVAALHHPDVGDIDLIWGEVGDPKNNYKGGHGLAKIVAKHPEVVENLQEVLLKTKVNFAKSGKQKLRLYSADGRFESVVSLSWIGKSKKWLLTAYETDRLKSGVAKIPLDVSASQDSASALRTNTTEFIVRQKLKKFQQKLRLERLRKAEVKR